MSRLDKVLSLVAPYLAIDLKTAVAFQTWLDEDGIQADTAKLWSRVILFGFHYIRQSIPDYLGAPFPESLYLRQLAKFQDFPSCPRTFIEIIETTGGQLSGLLPRLFPLPQISSTSTILRTLPRNFPFYSHSLYDELVSAIKRESIDDWIRLLGATHDLVCGRERERREDKEMTASGRFEMLVEELEGTDWSVVEGNLDLAHLCYEYVIYDSKSLEMVIDTIEEAAVVAELRLWLKGQRPVSPPASPVRRLAALVEVMA